MYSTAGKTIEVENGLYIKNKQCHEQYLNKIHENNSPSAHTNTPKKTKSLTLVLRTERFWLGFPEDNYFPEEQA